MKIASKRLVERARENLLKKQKAAAAAKADLQDTTATMEDDKKYLADLTATCAQKASDFEARQQLRDVPHAIADDTLLILVLDSNL